ncbi:RidA family protein [Desertihabitans brevis]|nr:RidA family protein [Desertihabitans brevis]
MTRAEAQDPDVPRPAARYRVALRHGDQVFVAGMTPREGDHLLAVGRVGTEIDVGTARELAGVAAARSLAAAASCRVAGERLVPLSMTVYVSTVDPTIAISEVADGASDRLVEATGSLPVRAAVAVAGLPGGAPVEVSLVVGVVPEGGARG